MKKLTLFVVLITFCGMNEAIAQWNTNGNNIYNTNSGNVGIGSSSPTTLLHVQKNMAEPTITVQNLGGIGGATYTMLDNVSGANWKFKATNSGGFKIRDHASGLDVFVIEKNSAANLLYLKNGGNIGIGTAAPASSALVDMSSTTKGFLPPRMTQAELELISNPVNGLVVFNTSENKFYAYLADENTWKEILFGTAAISPVCNNSFTINHVAGTVAPVTKTVTYGTATNIPGEPSKCWITSNLGADHQATAVDDDSESSAGWYWQFNRMQGYKHDGTIRTPNTTWITSIDEDFDWQAINDPCNLELGDGWRLPTSTEWLNVDASGNWTDWSGPWDSALKMHAAGYLWNSSGNLNTRGSTGNYNSTSQADNTRSWIMGFTNSDCYVSQYNIKAFAISIRCLKD